MIFTYKEGQYDLAASSAVILPRSEWESASKSLNQGVHPADFWQSGIEKNLSVAEVRALQYFALRSPVGDMKLAILFGGDAFRAETANALLKLIEEPPTYLNIVILSETDHFLPTLSSRLRKLQFSPDSATIDSKWQSALKRQDVTSSAGRRKTSQLLYLQALTHSSIKPEPIIDSFS